MAHRMGTVYNSPLSPLRSTHRTLWVSLCSSSMFFNNKWSYRFYYRSLQAFPDMWVHLRLLSMQCHSLPSSESDSLVQVLHPKHVRHGRRSHIRVSKLIICVGRRAVIIIIKKRRRRQRRWNQLWQNISGVFFFFFFFQGTTWVSLSVQHESSQFVVVPNRLLFVVRKAKLFHVTKLHECCDRAACIGNALMSRPMFNILVCWYMLRYKQYPWNSV